MKKEVAGVKCRRKVTYNDARERPRDQATHKTSDILRGAFRGAGQVEA